MFKYEFITHEKIKEEMQVYLTSLANELSENIVHTVVINR